MKSKMIQKPINIKFLCRLVCNTSNSTKIEFVKDSKLPPTLLGTGFYHTTLGGKIVHYPNAYGYRTIYHPSTLRIEVGEHWKPKIPKGMILNISNNGLEFIRISDGMDFHCKASLMTSRKDFCGYVRSEMAKNYEKRLESKRKDRQFNKFLKNTYVTFNDARNAGNCVAGILNYAKNKLKISEKEFFNGGEWLTQVPAKLLYRLDPKNPLVINSINRAIERETTISI
jgi:hypothetical protein